MNFNSYLVANHVCKHLNTFRLLGRYFSDLQWKIIGMELLVTFLSFEWLNLGILGFKVSANPKLAIPFLFQSQNQLWIGSWPAASFYSQDEWFQEIEEREHKPDTSEKQSVEMSASRFKIRSEEAEEDQEDVGS